VPSHDITREPLQFLRGSFSITASVRFIRCSLNIKLTTFCSGPVFCKFSEILSLVLSFLTRTLKSFLFFFSVGEPHTLLLFLSAYPGRTFPPQCVSFLSSFVCILACLFPPQEGSGPVMFLLSEETRVSLGLQENCTLWYFGLTIFCLLSQTLHASIHGGS
jgi:hypothetical protein